ncbi:hypothetical protein [Reichenbachiella sp.]|uniref:hypothetical protein n=1 Tax=Reichenbachiella sp. TaxID=2184521 RepID=UPI003BB105D7
MNSKILLIIRTIAFIAFVLVSMGSSYGQELKKSSASSSQLVAPMIAPPPPDPDPGGGGGGGGGSTNPPATPSSSFTTTYNCGSTRVKRNSNPPAGVVWYWQTSSSGTSKSYQSNTYTFSSSRNVYLRSYNPLNRKWGGSISAGYKSVNPNTLNAGNTSGAKTICYGASAGTLGNSSSASGGLSSYSYQWQVSSNNSNWSNISGATGKTYSPGNLTSTRYYRRRVTSCGKTKYAASEKITVRGNLKAGSIGNAQTVCYNGNPSTLTNTSSASGGATRTYQWRKSTTSSSSGFSNISGATGSTYNPPSITKTTWYRRRVTSSSNCGYKDSNAIKVTMRSNLNAGSIGNAQTLCYNDDANTLTNTTSASGGATRTYQWQHSTTNSSSGFANISGATGSTYNPPALSQTTWYRRKVTSSSGCGTKYSNVIQVTIHQDLTAGSISNAQTLCYGGDPAPISSTSVAAGGTNLSYIWQRSTTNSASGYSDISGTNSSAFDPSALTQTTWFRRKVTSGSGCGTQYTNAIEVTIHEELDAGEIGSEQSICQNGDPEIFTNISAASGGTSLTYQWQQSTESETGGFTDISGANASIYDAPEISESTWYRRAATSASFCGTVYTQAVRVNVHEVLQAGAITPTDQQVCRGEAPADLEGTLPVGGDENYTYQWESSTDGLVWNLQLGATGVNYSFGTVNQTISLRRTVTSACGSAVSNVVDITVKELPEPGTIGDDIQICVEDPSEMLTGTEFVDPELAFQWQSSDDELVWIDIPGETQPAYTPPVETKFYRRGVIKNGCINYSGGKKVEAIICSPDAGTDQIALNNDAPVSLVGSPSGGIWTGRGVESNVFHPEVAGIGEHELTYTYTSGPGGERMDKMIAKVEFNAVTPTFLSNYAFEYRYDERQRMIMKQVPSAGTVYMVYDNRDRLVLTQDGNQRPEKEWTFTKYDQLNRPVLTGIYTHSSEIDQATMQGIVDQFYTDAEANTMPGERVDEWYEERGSAVHGYTNTSFPLVSSVDKYLTVTYYDDYGFSTDSYWSLGDYTSENRAKTYITGAKVRVDLPDGTYDWNESVTLYDSRYRVASTISQDYQGNKDTFVNEYYSLVHPLVVKTIHTHESAITLETTEITKEFDHDHADRLMKVTQTLDVTSDPSFTAITKVILENEYNELGELIKKKLNDEGDKFSQEVDYQYNIRGWLTKINDPVAPDPKDYFAMQLKYDEAGQYNGNIGATAWKNPFETVQNQYDYTYDPVNRLKSATYNSGAFSVPNIDYDANGNIMALQRKGLDDTGSTTDWDILDYKYVGNQLTKVDDTGSTDLGFKDGASASTEYEYDANGNMISDANKGIEKIEYNHLNLPVKVTMFPLEGETQGGVIEYIYDAAGTKLAQMVYEGGTQTKRTDYQGAFIYESKNTDPSQLQFIQHEEGRIVYETDVNGDFVEYEYQYHLKDHLGNVRATFKEEGDQEQSLASFEPAVQTNESNYFTGYDGMVKITAELFNHTAGGNTSIRLNGSTNEREGMGKSLKVKPGDVIDMEVYAKYFLQSESGGWTNAMNTMVSNIASNVGGIVVDGGGIGADANPFVDWSGKTNPTAAPEAYLNYMVFDEYYNPISEQTGHQQISELAKETGINVTEENPTGEDHEKLEHSITITQSGYVYIYLSNEEDTPIDVFFDDFTVTQHHTPIVSKDDYYPFGLTFASYNRPASIDQKWKFQGQEHIDDLGVNWDSFKWRNHQPDLGRFFNVDPMADAFYYNSPYAFSENKVTTHIELEGLEAFFIHGTSASSSMWTDDLVRFVRTVLTSNTNSDVKFSWDNSYRGIRNRNWLFNDSEDRAVAGRHLAAHVMKNRIDGEGVTLIGHSHGGNVAIQAAKLLWENHGVKVDIVNFNTPAYNDKGPEDPEFANFYIKNLMHFYTKQDGVAGGLAGDDKYKYSGSYIQQIQLVSPARLGWMQSHYMNNVNRDEVSKKAPKKKKKKKKKTKFNPFRA